LLQTSNGLSSCALAFDLLPGVHRSITTVRSIDMSISGMTGTSALWQQLATASTQSKISTTAQASSTTASSTGGTGSPFFSVDAGISVGLPNGMSVGVFHLAQGAGQGGGTSAGSSSDASYSQMIASIEQLVAAFENSPAAASSTAAQTSSTDGTSSAGGTGASATSGSGSDTSIDGISVDLPNGLSVEVFHADQGNETSADSAASFAQMANTMEQLVAALDKYPGAAAGAYANAGADASSASTVTGSLNAVA
jgi:hypothetical protein